MPRNSKCKCVGSLPRFSSFVPADRRDEGHQLRLSVEEFETIRLIDYEGLNQELCAERMGVGRGTVQALYAEARKKTAVFWWRAPDLRFPAAHTGSKRRLQRKVKRL